MHREDINSAKKYRFYAFTIQNYTDDDYFGFGNPDLLSDDAGAFGGFVGILIK